MTIERTSQTTAQAPVSDQKFAKGQAVTAEAGPTMSGDSLTLAKKPAVETKPAAKSYEDKKQDRKVGSYFVGGAMVAALVVMSTPEIMTLAGLAASPFLLAAASVALPIITIAAFAALGYGLYRSFR